MVGITSHLFERISPRIKSDVFKISVPYIRVNAYSVPLVDF